jgi:hypothetical protein
VKLSKLSWAGAIVAGLSLAPLVLYVIFGPKDGNPIGLGLLMFFGVPIGVLLFVVGFITARR